MSTRERIVDAAWDVIATRGLAKATTKEIARAAGLSEAMLYKHFHDKTDLLVTVLTERLPALVALCEDLPAQAGAGNVTDTLQQVARTALAFYRKSFPLLAGVFAEPQVLAAHRAALQHLGTGPHRPAQRLSDYLRAEQDLGRIRSDLDPEAIAALLLGACFQQAFLHAFATSSPDAHQEEVFVAHLTQVLAPTLQPGPASTS